MFKRLWQRFKNWLLSLRWFRRFWREFDLDLIAQVARLYSLLCAVEGNCIVVWRMKGEHRFFERRFYSVEDLLLEYPLVRSNV